MIIGVVIVVLTEISPHYILAPKDARSITSIAERYSIPIHPTHILTEVFLVSQGTHYTGHHGGLATENLKRNWSGGQVRSVGMPLSGLNIKILKH